MGKETDTAHARVNLKLAALAYVGTRHGADACEAFVRDGTLALCGAARAYVRALTGRELSSWAHKEQDDARRRSIHGLEMAAIAYDKARHGSDSAVEFVRAALGMLCQAAITFCETMAGESLITDAKELAL